MTKTKYRYLIIGICLVLGLILSFLLSFNHWLKIGIEKTISDALGLPTQIQFLSFTPWEGKLKIEKLTVNNKPGFSSPYLLAIDRFAIELLPSTLFTPTIKIQDLRLDRLEIFIEQGLALNIAPVLAQLQHNAEPGTDSTAKPEPKVKADQVAIEGVKIHAQLPFWQRSLELPNINLQNLQAENGEGITISELLYRLFSTTLTPVIRDNLLELPKTVLELVKRSLDQNLSKIEQPSAPR